MRYEALTRFLESQRPGDIRMTFGQIEGVLDRALPVSARRHQAWWANTETHSHAFSWLRIGWKTRSLDLAGETVVFSPIGARQPEASRGFGEGAAASFRSEAEMVDPVTFDRAKLTIAARRILGDYTAEFGSDVQAALDKALEEARVARRGRLIDSIVRTGPPSAVSSVDLIREDRDGR